jgi:hypothetical protein
MLKSMLGSRRLKLPTSSVLNLAKAIVLLFFPPKQMILLEALGLLYETHDIFTAGTGQISSRSEQRSRHRFSSLTPLTCAVVDSCRFARAFKSVPFFGYYAHLCPGSPLLSVLIRMHPWPFRMA